MSGYELIPPRRRTVWQKAGEACGMLVIYESCFYCWQNSLDGCSSSQHDFQQ